MPPRLHPILAAAGSGAAAGALLLSLALRGAGVPAAAASNRWDARSTPLAPVNTTGLLGLLGLAGGIGVAAGRRRSRRRRLESLRRLDPQSGLLSLQALSQDLREDGLERRTASTPWQRLEREPALAGSRERLLLMINLRLLEQRRPFLEEEGLQELFGAARAGLAALPGATDGALRCYRASDNRMAVLLTAPDDREEDADLLSRLHAALVLALAAVSREPVQPEDLLITAQRLEPGPADPSQLRLHAYAEIVALEDGQQVRLIEPGDEEQVSTAAALREALGQLREEDIELVLQPILLLASPGRFGLEVLTRFRGPLLGGAGTGRVVRLAQDLGIAHQLDALVIARVSALQGQLSRSAGLRERIDYVSLNISSDSIATPERLEALIASLRDHRLEGGRICLEFSEMPGRGAGVNTAQVNTASERLMRELNVRVFIDDFGSGLSNYRRLCSAWYDAIKLDIELVQGLGDSFRMQRYVGSFIDTVHALGKSVVVEGVENHGDLAAAVRLGADGLQGYLMARPMAWEALADFLNGSPWADATEITAMAARLRASDRLLDSPAVAASAIPLERHILDNWHELRSFEEFVLLFINELRRWGLDILRLSLAFLPDEDDIDCSQYVWYGDRPGEVTTLRRDRAFLAQPEHLQSPLHHLATVAPLYRQRLGSEQTAAFPFLRELQAMGCSDYLGMRLDSRGISIPVLTIALQGGSLFSDEQVQRITAMSSLLSLLFYTFESERAKRLALLDPLTNLPNRRHFDSFLRALLTSSEVAGSPLALVLLDLDRFKRINDSLGHGYGDACLREVAARLDADLRRGRDVAARLGGEEFGLILPETGAAEALAICERLRIAVCDLRVPAPEGEGLPLSISLGIAAWNPSEDGPVEAESLLQLADDCLYAAKNQGRDRSVMRRVGGSGAGGAAISGPAADGGASGH